MNEPPGARARVGLTGLTMAEYFRDEEGADTLLFVDNIFRYLLAGSEVSALLGRMPSAVGYQPTLASEMGELQERITSTRKGSITSVQAVYVPADDYTDPAIQTVFAHLGATLRLERSLVEIGIYPAVDPLGSSSRFVEPAIVGQEHYDAAPGGERGAKPVRGRRRVRHRQRRGGRARRACAPRPAHDDPQARAAADPGDLRRGGAGPVRRRRVPGGAARPRYRAGRRGRACRRDLDRERRRGATPGPGKAGWNLDGRRGDRVPERSGHGRGAPAPGPDPSRIVRG